MFDNGADCVCKPPIRTTSSSRIVFSMGGSTVQGESAVFVFTSEAEMQIAPLLDAFRVTALVNARSAQLEFKLVYQYTDDGCTWSAAQSVDQGTWLTATTTSAWNTSTANFKRGIRVGVVVRQTTGTNVEMADLTLIIDWDLRS